MSAPKIIEGICEYCGVDAKRCPHFRAVKDPEIKTDGQKIPEPLDNSHLITEKICDIVIPHHDRHDMLKACLDSIFAPQFNIIIVGGGTFAHNNNEAAKLAKTDKILFLNDDTEPGVKTIMEMIEMMDKGNYDVIHPAQHIPSEQRNFYGIGVELQENGFIYPKLTTHPEDVRFPNGYCLLFKRQVWEDLGGFDEEFENGGEDGDLGLRMLDRGLKIGYYKERPILHRHSSSSGRFSGAKKNQLILERKWPLPKVKKLLGFEDTKSGKKLNVLVATNHLDDIGGSETYTYALYNEMVRRGHNVDVYALTHGELWGKKMPIVGTPKPVYDLLLINHKTTLEDLKPVQGFKIFTSHGIYPGLEQPIPGANRYVSISEEVHEHLYKLGFYSRIIRNGIDLDYFKSTRRPNKELKSVLCMCKTGEAVELVQEACKIAGVEFFLARKQEDIRKYINNADLVVTLGRGAYEAMACERNVIVFDMRVYTEWKTADGFVMPGMQHELMANNFSGRAKKMNFDANRMAEEFKKYHPKYGKQLRAFVEKHYNIRHSAASYIDLFEGAWTK